MHNDRSFQCSACKRSYTSNFTFTVCPYCFGQGPKQQDCICKDIKNSFGVRLGRDPDPKCPHHGEKPKPDDTSGAKTE